MLQPMTASLPAAHIPGSHCMKVLLKPRIMSDNLNFSVLCCVSVLHSRTCLEGAFAGLSSFVFQSALTVCSCLAAFDANELSSQACIACDFGAPLCVPGHHILLSIVRSRLASLPLLNAASSPYAAGQMVVACIACS